jgi:dTDP-4-amino-4,6-dideoxygalactose transaminase
MPYYKDLGWKFGDMPFAEKYYENCISIPIFPSLLDEEQDYVIKSIKEFYA